MRRNPTIGEAFADAGGYTAGFDYQRLGLACAVLCWHSLWISGNRGAEDAIRSSAFLFFPAAIIPMFFALSGFLVANSLQRTKLPEFITLRIIRIVPALAVEVTLSAIVLGAAFTTLPLSSYFFDSDFYAYFLNIVGFVHFELPGVFSDNPAPHVVNAQLWTIPFELECYLVLIFLSLFKFSSRRGLFLCVVVALSLALTGWSFFHSEFQDTYVTGRVPVLCFLAAVAIHLYRDKIPCSTAAGCACLVVSFVLLPRQSTAFLAAFPMAYATVWLGLKRPPKIPFGDLSYGIYLFHFPIEQTIVHLLPGIRSWWLLSLMALPVATAFAWLSWTFVEGPILRRKKIIALNRYAVGKRCLLIR